MTTKYDAIIIGTGQAGPALAGRLNAAGMKVAIIERDLIGGSCVQRWMHSDQSSRSERSRCPYGAPKC